MRTVPRSCPKADGQLWGGKAVWLQPPHFQSFNADLRFPETGRSPHNPIAARTRPNSLSREGDFGKEGVIAPNGRKISDDPDTRSITCRAVVWRQ